MTDNRSKSSGQVVLVFQGGGALGAYQAGVYQAVEEAGIEPDWVVGTSIGAINAAIIAGNKPEQRLARLREFWRRMEQPDCRLFPYLDSLNAAVRNWNTLVTGVADFFTPNPLAVAGPAATLGVGNAGYYNTEPLRRTLSELIDIPAIAGEGTRLTVGAVNVRSGRLRYFDSADEVLGLEHIMASGALPPAFPAVEIAGDWYWDGGIYSNTPIEVVFDDAPRRDSLIFAVNLWQQSAPLPESLLDVAARQKDIQYASRAEQFIADERALHHLRHVISSLEQHLPATARADHRVQGLLSWGCRTQMHLVRLFLPRLEGEDQSKDIDFSARGIGARWQAGYEHAREMLERAPWRQPVDPVIGVYLHDGPGGPE